MSSATAAGRPTLSAAEARWLAIEAQGLGRSRPKGPAGRAPVRRAVDAVGTVQLDAINVVERTQFLVLFSRVGVYDVSRLHELTGPGGHLFEYWGHAASLLPAEHQPLFRWRMEGPSPWGDGPAHVARREAFLAEHGPYIEAVRQEIRDRGPLAASQLSDPRRRDGEWWGRRSVGRQALEFLFFHGELAGWRTPNFERVYDLPERVIPTDVLARPTPPIEEAHRQLLLLAARSLGVASVRDLADYYRISPRAAAPRVAELVESGALVEVAVDGWTMPAFTWPEARPEQPRRSHATVLSPFDSLIWERSRTTRVFGFDYRIEVYVPAPKRTYGYFVLPVLLGDELVARLDLKADRKASMLRVQAAHLEPGAHEGDVATATAKELGALREWLGLERIEVVRTGNFAVALRRAVAGQKLPPS